MDIAAKLETPYVPFVCPEAVAFFEDILRPDHVVFEWGSGASTIWLAERAAKVVTVEGYPQWRDLVLEILDEKGLADKVDLLFIPPHGPKSQVSRWNKNADAILAYPDEHFDIVYIDAYHRTRCLRNGHRKVKPGGWLVADDSQWKFFAKELRPFYEKWRCMMFEGKKTGRADDKVVSSETAFLQRPER